MLARLGRGRQIVRRIRRVAYPEGATVEQRFEMFHEEHPWLLDDMRRLALETKAAGARRWSVWSIANVLRWRYAMENEGGDFKINNNFLAYYARLLMETTPELHGFFETRNLKETA